MSRDLTDNFWSMPDHAFMRVTRKEWKEMLLDEKDRPLIRGHMRQVIAIQKGAGIVELRLALLPAESHAREEKP